MKAFDEQNGLNELDHHLVEQIEAILTHPDAPDADLEPLPRFAAHLAGSVPHADELFRETLEARLVTELSRRKEVATREKLRIAWLRLPRIAGSLKFGLAASMVLLLSLAIALPVLGGAFLGHVSPREATALPAVTSATFQASPTSRRWAEIEDLEKAVGFPLWMPTWLPEGCSERERFSISPGGVGYANLTYSCMDIMEQKGQGVQQPYVGEGSMEEVTISGQPAIYIDGGWVLPNGKQPSASSLKDAVWRSGIAKKLIFERNGVVLYLSAGGGLARTDLFAIAESMQQRSR